MTKHCSTCEKTKDVNFFNRSTSAKDGWHSQCRSCQQATRKASKRKKADEHFTTEAA